MKGKKRAGNGARKRGRVGDIFDAEVRAMPLDATTEESRPQYGLGSRFAARFRKQTLRSQLPEMRGQRAQPLDL